MSIFTRKDGPEGYREDRKTISDEFARRRADEEKRVAEAEAATRGPTAEEAEALSKARIAAGQAITAQRNAEIQALIDLKGRALGVAAIAEVERNAALRDGNVEAAVQAQMRVIAANALPEVVDQDVRRRFPPAGFHF